MGRPRKNAFDEETVTRVLRAAETAFGNRGYRDTRLEDIAGEASIRRSSLLYHFGSKDDLYQEVVEKAFRELRRRIAEAITGEGEFERRLEDLTAGLVAFAEERPAMLSVILRAMIDARSAGRSIVEANFVPLIDAIEDFMIRDGAERIPSGFPVRAAIVQLFCARMVNAASGSLGVQLWPQGTSTEVLTRRLFLDPADQTDGKE